jgi:hypothetical protein
VRQLLSAVSEARERKTLPDMAAAKNTAPPASVAQATSEHLSTAHSQHA